MSENYQTERNFILRLKQNTNIITSGLKDAKIALKTQMRTLEDKGQLIVCFYKGSEQDETIRVIGGITGSETLFVNDYEVTKDLTDAILALKDGVSTDFDTLKKIEDYINSLDFESDAVEGQYISEFKEENGQITELKRVNLSDSPINGYNKGTRPDDLDIKPTDDFKTAFKKLEHHIDKNKEDIDDTIDSLDYTYNRGTKKRIKSIKEIDGLISIVEEAIPDFNYERGDKKIIKTITQEDGLIAVTEEELKAETVTTPDITGTTTTIAVNGGTVKDQIADIAKTIKTNENNAEHYKIVEATDTEKANLGDNIYTAYKLMCWSNGAAETTATQKGEWIKIEKDQHLKDVKLETVADKNEQYLVFTYIIADGTEKEVKLDIKSILFDYEYEYPIYVDATDGKIKLNYKNGLKLNGNHLMTFIDSSSEKDGKSTPENFLEVVENGGIKIKGVKDEITRQINELDATVSSGSTSGTVTSGHISISITETDGKLTSTTLSETNIASKSDLDDEITARKAVDGQSGQTYTANNSTNYIKTATSLNDADIKLDNAIKAINDWDVIDGGSF